MKTTIKIDGSQALPNVRGSSDDCCKYGARLVLLVLLIVVACERAVVVPHALIGKWKTSAPNYADRYLKLSEHTLTFGVGAGEEISHAIDKIESKKGVGGTIYSISYRDAEGEEETLTFTYRPDFGGTLQLKNSRELWEKDKEGDS